MPTRSGRRDYPLIDVTTARARIAKEVRVDLDRIQQALIIGFAGMDENVGFLNVDSNGAARVRRLGENCAIMKDTATSSGAGTTTVTIEVPAGQQYRILAISGDQNDAAARAAQLQITDGTNDVVLSSSAAFPNGSVNTPIWPITEYDAAAAISSGVGAHCIELDENHDIEFVVTALANTKVANVYTLYQRVV